MRENHEDIIEHIVVSVLIRNSVEPLHWRMLNRHCEVSELGNGEWIVSGNTRVWVDFFRKGVALEALPVVRPVAPAVFAEFDAQSQLPGAGPQIAESQLTARADAETQAQWQMLRPIQDGPMRVTMLGFTQPLLRDPELLFHHGSATFFFEGISRACTHQLVRHRLASFSQESQRYVELSKGGWQPIVPPAVAHNPEAVAELAEFWEMAEKKYQRLRELGIRKEDARFLLPNAAETRIVTTMNFAAWSHFLWLRAVDKAAQWEIRAMGQHTLAMLYAIAPEVFAEHWKTFQEKFAAA
jgi:thymidylate synthase (FAD)